MKLNDPRRQKWAKADFPSAGEVRKKLSFWPYAGLQKLGRKLAWFRTKRGIIFICMLCRIALVILMQQKYFFLWLWVRAPKSMATMVRTLPMKRRKRLACDVLDTSATLANLVHDVSDIDWQTQIAALTAEFLRLSNVNFFLFFFYKPDHKLTTAVVSLSSVPILSKGPVMWLCFMPHFSLHHNQ